MAARQALVKTAMANLKLRKKGATLALIQKQLLSSYSGKINVNNRRLLSTALKGLLDKGQVQKNGGNYRLARVARLSKADEDELGVPQRRRRRGHHSGGRRRRHHGRRRHHRRRRHGRRRHSRRRRHHRRRRTRRRR